MWPRSLPLLSAIALVALAAALAGRAAAETPTMEVEPNDDFGNATVLPHNGSAQGNAGIAEVDYWSLTLPNGGWVLIDYHGVNGRTDLVFMTLDPPGPGCTRHPYGEPGKMVLNASAGGACPLRVNAAADGTTYYISLRLGNTSSALSETINEEEPDEVQPNVLLGGYGGAEGWVDIELDPVDTWVLSPPEGDLLVEARILCMRGTGELSIHVVSGGIAFQQTVLMGGGSWFTAKFLTPPANRTVVFEIHATQVRSNYGISFSSKYLNLADPPVPNIKEIERDMLKSWTFTPREDGRVTPADFDALSRGDGVVYGEALCVVSGISNDAFDFSVDQGRFFGVLHGQGRGLVSARTQVVHAPRGEPACFDVLSWSSLWRHDGPGSDYFISGIVYETVTNRNTTELRSLFDAMTDAGHVAPADQLAFWAVNEGMTVDRAAEMGASNATLSAAVAQLDTLHISTFLNEPDDPGPPPEEEEEEAGSPISQGAIGMLAIAGLVGVAAGIWVWDPPWLHPGRRRQK